MSDKTKIEWTDATWNPVTGCDKVSPGCDHCYAETIAHRFAGTPAYPDGFKVTLRPERLDQPLRWKRPRRVFVNSMSDLFHADIPDEYIARVWAVMAAAPQHTFQVLTKRPGRMRSLLNGNGFPAMVDVYSTALMDQYPRWPLPNVWLGVSAEDQKWADVRIPVLLDTPAAVRFVSAEPLLGPIDFHEDTEWLVPGLDCPCESSHTAACKPTLDWVIVGGESGSGARPMHPDWVRTIRDQCVTAGTAFHFKQWGEHVAVPVVHDPRFSGGVAFDHPTGGRQAAVIQAKSTRAFTSGVRRQFGPGDITKGGVSYLDENLLAVRVGKRTAGRELDGRTWDEFPEVSRG